MLREGLIFVGTCDIAGHVRGKGFPASELHARRKTGIGWPDGVWTDPRYAVRYRR